MVQRGPTIAETYAPFWMRTLSKVKGLDMPAKICRRYSLTQVMIISRMSAVIGDVLASMVTGAEIRDHDATNLRAGTYTWRAKFSEKAEAESRKQTNLHDGYIQRLFVAVQTAEQRIHDSRESVTIVSLPSRVSET